MLYLSARSIRIALGLVGAFGAVFAPPWLPLVAMTALAIRFFAWEAIAIGMLVDLMWLSDVSLAALPLFTLAGIALVWGFDPLRKEFLIEKDALL